MGRAIAEKPDPELGIDRRDALDESSRRVPRIGDNDHVASPEPILGDQLENQHEVPVPQARRHALTPHRIAAEAER